MDGGCPARGHRCLNGAGRLSQLASSFMIESVEPGARYRFHDLTREYARRRALAEIPAATVIAVPGQAYRALLTLSRRAHAGLYGGDFEVVHSSCPTGTRRPRRWPKWTRTPSAGSRRSGSNIRVAVRHCAELGLVELCWDLAVSAHEFYTIRGYFDDWHATHTHRLRCLPQAGDKRGEGIVLACLNQPALVASRPYGQRHGHCRAADGPSTCSRQAVTGTARRSPCGRWPTRCAGKVT